MSGLSQGSTLLDKNRNTAGTHVHSATKDEFVTLSANKIYLGDEGEVVDRNNDTFYITIGKNPFSFEVKCSNNDNKISLLTNHMVYSGEEIWITTTTRNRYAVSGFCTSQPV